MVTSASERSASLTVFSPVDGAPLGTVPIASADDVAAAVARSRVAFAAWSALDHRQRRDHLLAWRRAIARSQDSLSELIHRENGKPLFDARQEVLLALLLLDHAAHRAGRVLRPRRRSPGLLVNYRASIRYAPFGLVGIIGPWNYPLSTPMGSIASALAAGNSAVFKPSELTPLTALRVAELAAETIPIPDLLQVVTGDGATGAELARAAIDKLSFTGSTATGRRVMAAAAERLTPVVMELGGKDALIVTADADLDQAAAAAVYGALSNAGQTCISIERVYVVDAIAERFEQAVVARVERLRCGAGADRPQIGPLTRTAQTDVLRAQLDDALARGARVLVGGPAAFDGRFVSPTVLTDVDDDMLVMREESFGPLLPIARVADAATAIARVNATPYGLGAAVFAGAEGRRIAAALHCGMVSIDAVLAYAAIPALPFGGVGDSGFGRIHGDEGLREFARVQALAEHRFGLPTDSLTFEVPGTATRDLRWLVRTLFAGGPLDRLYSLWRRLAGS